LETEYKEVFIEMERN